MCVSCSFFLALWMVIAAGRQIVYYYREKGLLTPRNRRGVFYLDSFTYILLSILSCYRSCIKTGKTALGGRPQDNSSLMLYPIVPPTVNPFWNEFSIVLKFSLRAKV